MRPSELCESDFSCVRVSRASAPDGQGRCLGQVILHFLLGVLLPLPDDDRGHLYAGDVGFPH